MIGQQTLFAALALFAGAMIPFQSAMNAQLGKSLASPYFSALTVFVVAAVGLTLYILAAQHNVPRSHQFLSAPGWSFLGGILGGAYVLLIVICAPRLGIGNVTIMVLMGQVLSALLIDQFGLLSTAEHAINLPRAIGVIFAVTGVYLINRF